MMKPGVFNVISDSLTVLMLKRVIGGEYVKKWCYLPYEGNPDGCPQIERCKKFPMWDTISEPPFYFLIRTFDLGAHTKEMHDKFPDWTDRQCRNSRLWQSHQDRLMKDDVAEFGSTLHQNSVHMLRPEMYGVNIYSTCRIHGYIIRRNPMDVVHRVAMVGKIKGDTFEEWFR